MALRYTVQPGQLVSICTWLEGAARRAAAFPTGVLKLCISHLSQSLLCFAAMHRQLLGVLSLARLHKRVLVKDKRICKHWFAQPWHNSKGKSLCLATEWWRRSTTAAL